MIRFLLRHPPDPRPSLVVQASDHDAKSALQDFRNFLYAQGCPNGLLFDARDCYILRDSYTSMKVDSLRVEATVPTADVLRKMNRPGMPKSPSIERGIERWVELLTTNWEEAIPDESEISQYFFTNIISAAAQASVSVKRDPAEDAA